MAMKAEKQINEIINRNNVSIPRINSWQDTEESESLDIYKTHNERHPSDYYREKVRQIKQQKIWVTIHTVFLLTISIVSLPLLHHKGEILGEFYKTPVCCYCLWVGNNVSISQHHEIEWSKCTNKDYVKFKTDQNICKYSDDNSNNTQVEHCGLPNNNYLGELKRNSNSDSYYFDLDNYSASSSILIWRFPKSYTYYGIMNIILVFAYVSFLIIVTFCYEIPLSVQLFIGNIVVSINTLYTYIKLYQYGLYDYHQQCPPHEYINNTNCYRNALPPIMEEMMHFIVYFVSIYAVYPFVFCIFFRYCSNIRFCNVIRSKLESCLLYLGIIGGILFLIMAFIMLIYITVHSTHFQLIPWLSNQTEKAFIIFLTIFLLLFSVDVFLLEHCRTRSIFMLGRWNNKNKTTLYLLLNDPTTSEPVEEQN